MDSKRRSTIDENRRSGNRLWPPVVTELEPTTQYMKRLTAVAVSHVFYLRKYYSDRYFEDQSLDYLHFKILVDDCQRTEECGCIICQLSECCDAIVDKMLKKLVVSFGPNNDHSAEECFTLKYNYDTNGFNISLDLNQTEENNNEELAVIGDQMRVFDMRQSIEQMLRSLELKCQNLSPLAEDVYCSLTARFAKGYESKLFIHPLKKVGRKVDVLSVGIDGDTDDKLSDTGKKRPFIRTDIKEELKKKRKNE